MSSPPVHADSGRFKHRFIDIGVNLTDPVFRGLYHGRRKHDDDLEAVLERSRKAGVESMIITGGSLNESRHALALAEEQELFATVGCHPTRSREFDQYGGGPAAYLQALEAILEEDTKGKKRVVAIGECGLDYDRLHFAPEEVQRRHFRSQLWLAKKHGLPLFLHSRAAHADFVQILREEGFGINGGRSVGAKGGVVHSFTGTAAEAAELVDMGFHIGFNGCSLKTEENVATVKSVPTSRILLETDAPWCSLTSTHASQKYLASIPAELQYLYMSPSVKPERFVPGKAVKGRNEPNVIGAVAWVICQARAEQSFENFVETAWNNTVDLFELESLM